MYPCYFTFLEMLEDVSGVGARTGAEYGDTLHEGFSLQPFSATVQK
jgi:hypothetical protein